MAFDVARVRRLYPALADGYAYLDGAAGTQVPSAVVEAIAGAGRAGLGNLGGAFPASARAGEAVAACRRAVADLVGGDPDGVVLGPNMTTLTYRLAGALAKRWGPGDELVVSRLDHDAKVRPWLPAPGPRCARSARWRTRWARSPTSTASTPPPTARSTWRRWARTSTPPAPTSGPGRTSARSSPTPACWPRKVAEHLAPRKVTVWTGHNYAWELTGALGIREAGSAVRAGLVHYNDRSDVDRLLEGVASLA